MALPSARNLPAGVTISRFGDSEIMEEVFSSFSRAIAAGVLMVLAVLVLLFADAMQPITIIFSMPLSIGGAFLALLLTGNAINLSVIIGFLMLMGIVTKLASTFLSLVFVPAAFTIMDDFGRILGSKLSRLIGPKNRNEMDGDEPT
jgi:HAE1 family hydrophobic/amphiphilic exporter-1